MLQNAYFLAKIGADTAENEQHFAEILPIGRTRAARQPPQQVRDVGTVGGGVGAGVGPGVGTTWRRRSGSASALRSEVNNSE